MVSVACLPLGSAAATTSELLEKGIYNEETKGDLDAAITIYQQVVGDAKAAQSLAAQAQFRLGQCYLKKNRPADATAAFEKLIRDFPDEKELVARAREHVPGDLVLGPVPWVDGERLHLKLTLGNGIDIGAAEYRAMLGESNGRKVWRVGSRMFVQGNSLSWVHADAESFLPLSSTWKHALLGEASATYMPGEVTISKVGKEANKIEVDQAVYDNEQAMYLMRRLPLAEGYTTTLPLISSLGGPAVIPVALEVKTRETVEVPAGKFECFKVELNVGQTFWFSTDAHRYLVKFEAGGATASLSSIAQRAAAAPVPFRNDALGISFTAPPDWVLHQRSDESPKSEVIHMLDAQAQADQVWLRVRPADSLPATARASVRAWAEGDIADRVSKDHKDFKIRAESWKTRTVSGHAAISVTADYLEKDKPMVFVAIYVVGPVTAEQFMLACPAGASAALMPGFESIVDSYRSK